MNDLTMAVQTIKDRVSALDVGKAIGLNVDQHGRCSCPFHSGKDRNMKLFPGNRGFSCFVCHESGDVIKLVRRYYDKSFKDCVAWFNDVFRLGLSLDGQIGPDEARRAQEAQRMRMEARAFDEWREKAEFDLALGLDRVAEMLEEQRDVNEPKEPDDKWNREFCQAVKLLPSARRLAEECWYGCVKKT